MKKAIWLRDRINAQTRVIAVVIPNTNVADQMSWDLFRTSIDAVEKQTGYNLLSRVPERVQQVIEDKVNKIAI